MRWRQNSRKLLLCVAILTVLAAVLWWEGRAFAPGRSMETEKIVALPPTPAVSLSPASDPGGETPVPSVVPEPSQAPSQAPAPEPDPDELSASSEGQEPPPDSVLSCTVSISCSTVLERMDDLAEEKRSLIPQDGVILPPTTVELETEESAFDLLRRVCKEQKLHMEFSETPVYHSAYIEGIQNLYELDCGPLSGWMYQVNGQFPNYSSSQYVLEDGDTVCWMYTCDLGEDIGGQDASGQQGE